MTLSLTIVKVMTDGQEVNVKFQRVVAFNLIPLWSVLIGEVLVLDQIPVSVNPIIMVACVSIPVVMEFLQTNRQFVEDMEHVWITIIVLVNQVI